MHQEGLVSWMFQRTEVEEINASGGVGELDVPANRGGRDKCIRRGW